MLVLALRGREAEAVRLIERTIEQADDVRAGHRGDDRALGGRDPLQRPRALRGRARGGGGAISAPLDMFAAMWSLPELVESADARGSGRRRARCGRATRRDDATRGHRLGPRRRGTVASAGERGPRGGGLYREAVERLRRTKLRADLARSHLLYGEWLRREHRRVDARAQLRAAHDQFTSMGMDAFAERARTELLATGGKARKRTVETRGTS